MSVVVAAMLIAGLSACGPRLSTGSAVSTPAASGVVEGQAISGPTCPVERPGQQCTRPDPGVTITLQPTIGRSYSARTGRDGRYSIRVAPGTYDVAVRCGLPGLEHKRAVTVNANQTTEADFFCDTGIR